MSQMLSMMKPLPHDAEYPSEFFVEDLEYTTRKRPTNGAPNLAINGALVVRH